MVVFLCDICFCTFCASTSWRKNNHKHYSCECRPQILIMDILSAMEIQLGVQYLSLCRVFTLKQVQTNIPVLVLHTMPLFIFIFTPADDTGDGWHTHLMNQDYLITRKKKPKYHQLKNKFLQYFNMLPNLTPNSLQLKQKNFIGANTLLQIYWVRTQKVKKISFH